MAETDYGAMLKSYLFSPYTQFGLGLLAGNTGNSKSQAFANAMGGGLQAAQSAQQMMREQANQQLLAQRAAREQQAFDDEKTQEAAVSAWAMEMMQKDPANAEYYKLMMSNPKFGLTWFKTAMDAQNDKARTDAYLKAASMRGSGGGGGTTLGAPDLNLSKTDIETLTAYARDQFGKENWDKLSDDQQLMYLSQAAAYLKKNLPMPGLPEGKRGPGVLEEAWNEIKNFFKDEGKTTDGWSVRKK